MLERLEHRLEPALQLFDRIPRAASLETVKTAGEGGELRALVGEQYVRQLALGDPIGDDAVRSLTARTLGPWPSST